MQLTSEHISQIITLTGFIASIVVWGVTLETRLAHQSARTENLLHLGQVRVEQFQQKIEQLEQDIRQIEQWIHQHMDNP